MGRLCANANNRGGIVLDAAIIVRGADRTLEGVSAMLSGVPHAIRDEGREGVDSPKLIVGNLMRIGRSLFRINRRSLSVGFPSREGMASLASLKRRVNALGVMPD